MSRTNEWLHQRTGEEMKRWVELGASLHVAAELAGLSESRFAEWRRLARERPDTPMGELITELQSLEAASRNGDGHYVSPTRNIVGRVPRGCNGQGAPLHLCRWND
jgi:hypothetical protein